MNNARPRRILVTRPQPSADDFADKLRREGFDAFVAPMTEYVEINATVGDLAQYQGLIFTSAQAVNILARHFTERYIPVFCVGDATAQTADRAGFRRVYSAQGDASALVALIKQRKDHHDLKRMLHICGEDTAEDFTEELKQDGIYVDRTAVYKAEFIRRLPSDIPKALQDGEISTVTFFSARAAQNFRDIVHNDLQLKDTPRHLEAVCLSDRVAAEVKDMDWRSFRVAAQPQLEAVMEILREKEAGRGGFSAMAAEPVIAAFGGLRPLASALDISPSTVQGWKERGVIPESRVDAVIKAAQLANIDTDLLWKKEGSNAMTDESDGKAGDKYSGKYAERTDAGKQGDPQGAKQSDWNDRRAGQDRRQKYTAPDAKGVISNEKYTGPDRRTGLDRRAYQQRQAERIAAEKWRFVNRSLLMGGFFLMVVLYAGGFMLVPEFFEVRQKAETVDAMQAQVDDLNKRILDLQKSRQDEILGIQNKVAEQEEKNKSFGQQLYERIGAVENAAKSVTTMADDAANAASKAATAVGNEVVTAAGTTQLGRDLTAFLRVLANLSAQAKTKAGQESLARAYKHLREVLATAPTDSAGLNAAIFNATKNDKDLQKLMNGIGATDLGAAALLLALNEFRSNVNSSGSFEHDLLIMQKFLGDDPKMKAALKRLAPYAQNGVLSRQQLQKEFSGLASDIVMAKLQGQDLSVKQEMLKRLSKLVKVRRIDDLKGNTVDATVARAQLLLDQGDVKGAMRELQTLEGAPAKAASPFMEAAAANVMAEDATTQLLQNVLQQFTPVNGAADTGDLQTLFDDVWNLGPAGLMPYLSGGARNPNVTGVDTGPILVDTPFGGGADGMGPAIGPSGD